MSGTSILVNAGEHEIAKAYTAGTITYHTAAAREEGRKKRSGDSTARAGVITAAAGGYAHHNAALLGKTAKAAGQIKTAGKFGVAAGAGLAVAGGVSSAVHGHRRKQHFKAAQAGRLEREPEIAKGLMKDLGVGGTGAAVGATLVAPRAAGAAVRKVGLKPIKAIASVLGKNYTLEPRNVPARRRGQRTHATMAGTRVGKSIREVTNQGGVDTLAKNAFGIVMRSI